MTKSATARKAMFCMVLVTIQFGMQPLLTHTFTPKTICKSTVIMVQEMIKFILAMSMLLVNGEFSAAIKG
jgi:UDP-sugar transporter A1/2/3